MLLNLKIIYGRIMTFECILSRNYVISFVMCSCWQKSKHLAVEVSVLEEALCGRVLEK
jgi:tRNA A-37 threonylcarbamoyl transferase component Bud32